MPDISMCSSHTCTQKHTCFRYLAKLSDYQSYGGFVQRRDPVTGQWSCTHYWPVKENK